MKYTATINILYNRTETAFIFIDHETGKHVGATISGGISNIRAIARNWNVSDGWDRSILFNEIGLKAREYRDTVVGWPYAGCRTEDLAQYIRTELEKPED
jgi:hypothetical protein